MDKSDIEKQTILARTATQTMPLTTQKQKAISHTPPLPTVKVFTFGCDYTLLLTVPGYYNWYLRLENNTEYHGTTHGYPTLSLPPEIPVGYHQLMIRNHRETWSCSIIISPQRCFEPNALLEGKRLWGACIQLYTLRSNTNWGIGDFSDLKVMIAEVAKRGGAFVGLNPIHGLYPANPESASPYSPSSRNSLNIIYIDVEIVAEFKQSTVAQTWWQSAQVQKQRRALQEMEWVDYSAVMALKLKGLQFAYDQFKKLEVTDCRVTTFEKFALESEIQQQAQFDALHAYLAQQKQGMWGWPAWPTKYQDQQSHSVKQFIQQHADNVRFYAWLQWIAHQQLNDCYALCQSMPIGLYRDLAVGVAEGGADTWCDKELYCLKASVGAPPDALGPLGQNWGLPPLDPVIMQQRAYKPFIDLLRANMRDCGALRIDHVMSLLRLWWIPYGQTADKGEYVQYPVDDLLAILALESQRQQCMIIGEDLGIVPDEIVSKLRDTDVYSYKVLYFEQTHEGKFKAPDDYPSQSMATLTTHDLPTLRGYWQSDDLKLGSQLGLYPDKILLKKLMTEREKNKQGLFDALCLTEKVESDAMTTVLNHAIHAYIARTKSSLIGLQPEDWLDMDKPVNVPGTTDQYPNWRRKLSKNLHDIFADAEINQLLNQIQIIRDK